VDDLGDSMEARARAWHHARQEAPCDTITAWEHGTFVRASRHPSFYFHNAVRVEDEPSLGPDELIAFADSAIGGTCRMITFDRAAVAERLRPQMEALGWRTFRQMLMLHTHPLPDARHDASSVCEVDYDDVHALRARWHLEDFPGYDPEPYLAARRAIDLNDDCTVLTPRRGGAPIGFAQLLRAGDGAEITDDYIAPEHRGRGLGTALTRAAVERGVRARELWIGADDEDRPKRLYARLGFRAAWIGVEFLLMPRAYGTEELRERARRS
jgi:ribosomal protein S18 acetylase RimI-like enzyme